MVITLTTLKIRIFLLKKFSYIQSEEFFSDKIIFTTELFIRLTYKEVILLKFSIFSPSHQSLYIKFEES